MAVLRDMKNHAEVQCPSCKCWHTVPPELNEVALKTRNDKEERKSIWCPYGHGWHYTPQREIDQNEQIRLERDRLKQQMAYKDEQINKERNRTRAYKGKVTQLKNRAAAGVCPCCSRHFENLERHMKTKHPTFKDQE